MCKATEYTEKLMEVYNSINNEYEQHRQELSKADLYEQDLLHKIEDGGFNACEGYYLSKMLYDNRQTRRKIKNELEPLSLLKNKFIDINIDALQNIHINVNNRHTRLSQLTEDKDYKPRVIQTGLIINNKARHKKTGEIITIISQADKDLYYCKFNSGNKNLVNIRDIEVIAK